MTNNYRQMWEDVGSDAGQGYWEIKFRPTYRIGLTNYLREFFIYKFLAPAKSDKLLDIGCASGRQIFKIADQIAEGQGVDIAASFIARADEFKEKKQLKHVHFQVSEIESLPFPSAYFNKIICAEVLEHVADKDAALKEIKRVLSPGGALIVSVPNLNADGTWWGRVLRFLRVRRFVSLEHFSQAELKKHGDSHVREFTPQSLREWLERSGFKVEELTTVSFIDGPYFDFLLKVPLHLAPLRRLIIWKEKWLSRLRLPYGRHIVLRARLG